MGQPRQRWSTCQLVRQPRVYTWHPRKPDVMNGYPNIEFVPMLWGPNQVGEFQQYVRAGYASHVLGFNEPDHNGQAHLDPGYAASLYAQHITPLASQGYRLGSPATTNGPDGIAWMHSFMNACGNCQISFMAAHWYGTRLEDLQAHLNMYHDTFGRPVWLTEYACQNFGGGAQCSNDQIWDFMRRSSEWMDNTSWIEKYSWFGALHNMNNVNYGNQILGGDGQPNALGWEYVN
ncbi:hypothetical protein FA15DRAFT_397075 [Coprinopsis marcescibilis]|uniref:Asl1-like glycosyl hydrolase catalytic domain-containing protein n=1 Tax=Coprinopsis marcescibilis TaxID=230819 RepID=A0A5C3L8E8_COPMA|nr:hypothetical protein FA15DRAFT_397075 [Coprinopsis marcescibilis]